MVGVILVASSCGDDDGGGDLSAAQQTLADSIAESLDPDDPDAPPGITEDDVACASDRMAGSISDSRIAELGLSATSVESDDFDLSDVDLNDDEQEGIIAAVEDCIDFRPLLVESMTAGGEISEDSAGCLADAFPEDFVTRAIRAGFVDSSSDFGGSTDDIRAVTAAMADCLTDEEFQSVGFG